MIRKIIEINQETCNGCGLCVNACKEGAIALENGKARLIREDYCDGLGNCLPVCPKDAIAFVEREAAGFNAEGVRNNTSVPPKTPGGALRPAFPGPPSFAGTAPQNGGSQLRQWPVQIRLAPVKAPYFEHARLLIAADCSAYAYGNFHADFMRNRVTLIGCPKLDAVDYTEKLTEILKTNAVRSLAVVRMAVPCCAGITAAAIAALKASGKTIPWRTIILSPEGAVVQDD